MYSTNKNFANKLLNGIIIMILTFYHAGSLSAQTTPEIFLNEISDIDLSQPIQVLNADDRTNRLFVLQQSGAVKVFNRINDNEFTDEGIFFQITGIPSTGEQGLLSMAFHPNYADNGRFFVFYTNSGGDLEVASYLVSDNPNRFDPSSRNVVLTIPHPTHSNHNGGEMHFGPDGYLYISTGDGGSGGDPSDNAQNTAVWLGKILRIDVDGENLFPNDNLIPNSPVYALGLRNPFRWSFDRETNDVWIGDVGQERFEEINSIPFAQLRGANFGWRCYEGEEPYNLEGCSDASNYIPPIHTYPIGSATGRSVIGGVVYRGTAFPALQGYYIGTDFFSNTLHVISKAGDSFVVDSNVEGVARIADFGESENGELYAVNRDQGTLYRVVGDPSLPVKFVHFSVSGSETNKALLKWGATEYGLFEKYEIEQSLDGSNFLLIGSINRRGNSGEMIEYTFEDAAIVPGRQYYYRLKAIDLDASHLYSQMVSFSITVLSNTERNAGSMLILPNLISNGRIELTIKEPFDEMQLINLSGQSLQKFDLMHKTGSVVLNCGSIPAGIYLAVLSNSENVVVEKLIFR